MGGGEERRIEIGDKLEEKVGPEVLGVGDGLVAFMDKA